MGRKSFANEYIFIKSIRNRIFPYFAQYLFEPEN